MSVTPQSPRLTAAQVRGGLLCVEMLEAIASEDYALLTLEDDYREKGTPARDVVGEFLAKVSGPAEMAGFTRILNEALAMHQHAGEPNLAYLRVTATHPWEWGKAVWARECRRALTDQTIKRGDAA